jgi:hypothetical protein
MPQFVFSLTLFISAALLFWIQLLTSKMILPVLGGCLCLEYMHDVFPNSPAAGLSIRAHSAVPPTILTRLHWLILAFAPSSLLLGVTAHLTTNIAAVPLFWVVPLVLYLLSFVIAFQRVFIIPERAIAFLQATFLVPVGILFLTSQEENLDQNTILQFGLHLTAFFVTALLCHLELARLRPSTRYLTTFYLFLSLGGALGGVFNALLAPIIFDDVIEYPLVLVVACLLRPGILPNLKSGWRSIGDFALPALMLGLFVFLDRYTDLNLQDWAKTGPLVVVVICAVAVFAWQARSIRFSLGMAVLIAAGYLISNNRDVLQQTRNFYGVLKVFADDSPPEHVLYNGTTVHGEQAQDTAHRLEPLSYYHPDGPLGQLFVRLDKASLTRRVAVVGLGAGTIACYERPGDHWTFFEINPVDIAIAENPALFTFLRDCPGQTDVVLGDARLSLMGQPNHSFGMIVLDAFNSDSIPVHLMTRDAMQLYLNKLESDGLLVYHVSNQHLDLGPVVANIAASLKLPARRFNDTMADEDSDDPFGRDPSDWIVIARDENDLTAIEHDDRWQALLPSPGKGIWTDDYSNLLNALVR